MSEASIEVKRQILTGSGKMERVHDLKIEQSFIPPLVNNTMRAILRDNDRDFKVGDDLLLRGVKYSSDGFDNVKEIQTGEWAFAHVTHVLKTNPGLKSSFVQLSVSVITHGSADNWKYFRTIKEHLIK